MFKLRELERRDIQEINIWRNRHELIDMLGAPFRFINSEVDMNWYENYMGNRANAVRCAIVKEENDRILGLVSLTDVDFVNRSAQFHIMIGAVENRNKGLGTFALREMLRHAFCNMNLERVELTVLESNKSARHLYEKYGFVQEGCKRHSIYKNGRFENMVMYSIIKDEYKMANISSGGGQLSRFCVSMVYPTQIKYYIMSMCDRAFQISILKKDNFKDLFDKIDVNGIFLAAYHTQIMGYAVFYANDLVKHEGFITLIAVLPEYWGQQIGNKILSECCGIARDRKMQRLRLEVRKDNKRAITFYRKNGFVDEKPCSEVSMYMIKEL